MGYVIIRRTITSDDADQSEIDAVADWRDVPALVVERITDRLPRLLFGPITVTITAPPHPGTDLPEVALLCTVPADDVGRPWRQVVAPGIRDFLTGLEAEFADRGRAIRVELRRAPGPPGCRAPWAKPDRLGHGRRR
jgi:hypothetical protein